ncbi:MAG: YdcF family protein [Alphaproteobacteria bacterium]|nr:YdcF family protein [Alphaproteobacteria bacterium]
MRALPDIVDPGRGRADPARPGAGAVRRGGTLALLALLGCGRRATPLPPLDQGPVVDAAIVPGCPAEEDGRLSFCLERRALWAVHLWRTGAVPAFITSGAATYNRWVEAEALASTMTAMGVPREAIHTETQALHTDENVAYSMHLADQLGFARLGVASDPSQARGACKMLRAWERPCVELAADYEAVHAIRVSEGVPPLALEPVPADAWMPLKEREQAIAEAAGERPRPPSWWVYGSRALTDPLLDHPPPAPPGPEPTLSR